MDSNTVVLKIFGWKVVENKIIYRISIISSTSTFEIQKRYSDFTLLQSLLMESGLGLLPSLPPKTLFSRNQDPNFINERMKGLQSYLSSLISRHDVFSRSLFLEFLELPNVEQQKLKSKQLVRLELLADICGIKQSVSGLFFEKLNSFPIPLLFVAHQESSVLSRLGRVWSIIETEETGSIFVWDISPFFNKSNDHSLIPRNDDTFTNATHSLVTNSTIHSSKFNCLVYSGFPYKCKNLVYNSNLDLLCLFSEYGYIEVYKNISSLFEKFLVTQSSKVLQLKEHIQPTRVQLHNSSIISVYTPFLINKETRHKFCLSIGNDNSIRLFCFEQIKIISGGNLNKRTNGSKLSCCYLENEYGRLGFFGSSSGLVLVLDMISQPPYLISNLNPSADCKFAVTCIVTGKNLLAVAYSTLIKIFNINLNPKQASFVINDNQPIRLINTNFFSDMDIGTIHSLFLHKDEFLFVGGTDVFSLFRLNINNENNNSPQLLFSYTIHTGPINLISNLPGTVINQDLNSNQHLNLLTVGEDGNILFWKISNLSHENESKNTDSKNIEEKVTKLRNNTVDFSNYCFDSKDSSEDSDEDLTSAFR